MKSSNEVSDAVETAKTKQHKYWFVNPVFWRRFLFVLGCIVTMIFLFYLVENIRGYIAWRNCKARLEEKGISLSLESVIPPKVPDSDNFAEIPLLKPLFSKTNVPNRLFNISLIGNTSFPKHEKLFSWQKGRYADLEALYTLYSTNQEFNVPETIRSPSEGVLAVLEKYNNIIEQLKKGSNRPYARFNINYEDNINASLSHLSVLHNVIDIITTKSIAELRTDDIDNAYNDVLLSIYIAQSFNNEPIIISQILSVSCETKILQAIWEGIWLNKWSIKQLNILYKTLNEVNYINTLQTAYHGELIIAIEAINDIKTNKRNIYRIYDNGNLSHITYGDLVIGYMFKYIPDGWYEQNKTYLADIYSRYILNNMNKNVIKNPNEIVSISEELETYKQNRSPYNILANQFINPIDNIYIRIAQGQSYINITKAACVLEIYKIENGQYPEELNSLVPKYIDQLPIDIIGGQPLKYKLIGDDRYNLYSVGWNGVDDGGVIVYMDEDNIDRRKGDWVWPLPSDRIE
ncbi:MAG: hypothetical protein K9N52_07995 [Verrucomicrobia bacterium]|nr:hypothetical protein [Verrucomicrobiota bacterium]